MTVADDLFLSEVRAPVTEKKTFSAIAEEDDADVAALNRLLTVDLTLPKPSKTQSLIAGIIMKPTRVGVIAGATLIMALSGGVYLSTVSSAVVPSYRTQVDKGPVTGQETAAEMVVVDTSSTPAVAEDTDIDIGDVAGTSSAADSVAGALLERVAGTKLLSPENIDLQRGLQGIAEITIDPDLAENRVLTPLPPATPVKTMLLAENQVQVHEDASPPAEQTMSASDLIDQIGFGSNFDATIPAVETVPAMETEEFELEDAEETPPIIPQGAVPVPAVKPAQETSTIQVSGEVSYQIIDREGEKAGFRRALENKPSSVQWFLVVEALDANGSVIPMHVQSMDSGEIKQVRRWAIEVDEDSFMRFSDEKKKTGKIANKTVGTAASSETAPTWSVKATGGMITEWE